MHIHRDRFTVEQDIWLGELMTGNRAQTASYLQRVSCDQNGDKYCCLGVACEMFYDRTGVIQLRDRYSISYGGEQETLPRAIQNLLLMYSEGGLFNDVIGIKFRDDLVTSSLAGMNDGGLTFKQIAKFIRQYPWLVFINFDKGEAKHPNILKWRDDLEIWEVVE